MTVEISDLEERLSRALKAAVASIPDEPPVVEWGELVRRRPRAPARRDRPHSSGRAWIVTAAAAVVVLAVVVTVAMALSPTSRQLPTFASRLLTAAPHQASAPSEAGGDWSLVSYLSDSSWHVNPEGPLSPGSIACQNSTTCYVVSGIAGINPAIAPTPGTVFNVSENSGASWARYQMPTGLGLTSSLDLPHTRWSGLRGRRDVRGKPCSSPYLGWRGALVGAVGAGRGREPGRTVVRLHDQVCRPLSHPCQPALVREGECVQRHLSWRHAQRTDLFDDRWRPDVEEDGSPAGWRRPAIGELCSWSLCRHRGDPGPDRDRWYHERCSVRERRRRSDLAERNAPTGVRSDLERTHAGRLRHVLDLLGDRDRRGAALGRFVR